jgi:hypothetical protein
MSCNFVGNVAQECRQNQTLLAPPRPLSIRDVYSTLRKLRYYLQSKTLCLPSFVIEPRE